MRRKGHAGIVKILENTRFRLDERVASPLAWRAYWGLVAREGNGKRIVPLVCQVCEQRPERITLSNLVSSTRSSARCACTWRPQHGTVKGRERVEAAIAQRGYELVIPEAEWDAAHLHRGENWRFVAMRCVACKLERHVMVSRGSASYSRLGKCPCQKKARGGIQKARPRARVVEDDASDSSS